MTTQIEEKTNVTKNTLHIPDHTGDARIMWDPRDADEVKIAKAAFKRAQEKGMIAYAVDPQGESTGEVIREFDPARGKIIMVKQLVGG